MKSFESETVRLFWAIHGVSSLAIHAELWQQRRAAPSGVGGTAALVTAASGPGRLELAAMSLGRALMRARAGIPRARDCNRKLLGGLRLRFWPSFSSMGAKSTFWYIKHYSQNYCARR